MKLKKLMEETPKYEGRFWSYSKRKFVNYDDWLTEESCCPLRNKETGDFNASESTKWTPLDETKGR
tara:strand:+ start:90 stop:287 length:198 start_codon:yes stop_codon:yes gene_type:complete